MFLTTWQLGNQALQMFDNELALRYYERELDNPVLRDAPGNRLMLHHNRVNAYLTAGRFDEGEAVLEITGQFFDRLSHWEAEAARLDELLAGIQRQGDVWGVAWNIGRWVGLILRRDPYEALGLLDECLAITQAGGAVVIAGQVAAWRVVVAAWTADAGLLRAAGEAVVRHFPVERGTWRGLGALGDVAQAIAERDRELFEAGIDVLTATYPRPYEVTECLLAWARVTGDAAATERAVAIYERLGLGPSWTERARSVVG